MFWGEFGVWPSDDPNYEICFEATPANMMINGTDVSAWLSATHAYEYDPATGTLTLNGEGAWIGISKLGTDGEHGATIVSSVSCNISFDDSNSGYDLMYLNFDYGDPTGYWSFVYVSYSDASLEPDLEEPVDPGDPDLPNVTPTDLFNTFASEDAADVADLVPTESNVALTVGVADPAGGATAVGQFDRPADGDAFADLKFQLEYDCQFDNFTTMSIDVYFPSSNDYSGALDQSVWIFLADASEDASFWETWELNIDDTQTAQDEWVTVEFDLGNALSRDDIDLIGLKVGGDNHTVGGTFYIRNFSFQ